VAINPQNPLQSLQLTNFANVPAPGAVTLTAALATNTLTMDSGDLDGLATLSILAGGQQSGWIGGQIGGYNGGAGSGTVSLAPNAVLNIGGEPTLDNLSFWNSGKIDWQNGSIFVKDGALIDTIGTNARFQSEAVGAMYDVSGGAEFRLDPGTTYTQNLGQADFQIDFYNAGATVNLANGMLILDDGSYSDVNATYQIQAPSALTFSNVADAAAVNTLNGAIIAGTGTAVLSAGTVTVPTALLVSGTLEQTGGVLTGAGAVEVTGTYNFDQGDWDGGGQVVVNANANLVVGGNNGNGPGLFNRQLLNFGATTFENGNLRLGSGMDVTNSNNAQMTVAQGMWITSAAGPGQPVAKITNNGTFTDNAAMGAMTLIGVPFVQNGSLVVAAGNLPLEFTQNLTVNAGATVLLQGGNANLEVDGTLTIAQGGALIGSGLIWTNQLVNSGTISIVGPNGTAGTLAIRAEPTVPGSGNYTQTGTGVLNMRLLGAPGAGSSDKLTVDGQASLNGGLFVTLAGYAVSSGDVFPVIAWGALNPNAQDFAAIGVPGGMSAAPDRLNNVYKVTAN
jgi:hypothetical protein